MRKNDTNKTANEKIAEVHGVSVEHVELVKSVRQGVEVGDVKLAAQALGFTPNYITMVLHFRRKSQKALDTLLLIQENRRQLLADSPHMRPAKIVHQLNEEQA